MTQVIETKRTKIDNSFLAAEVMRQLLKQGVEEFCVCPGARNSPFFEPLIANEQLKKYYWFEERSAAFFALGRSRASQKPVAVITTSGSASAELLPAAMEAYYTGVPLLLITADRPRRFRGTGAPQAAEQVNLFGPYVSYAQDIEGAEKCQIGQWNLASPAHINVCFEEPNSSLRSTFQHSLEPQKNGNLNLDQFLEKSKNPLVVVSGLRKEAQQPVAAFLQRLHAPVYLEATSGIREMAQLAHLRIARTENLWTHAASSNYPIDGVLRIGGVPTLRLWRDLEDIAQHVEVCSYSELPFSGLSRAGSQQVNLTHFFEHYHIKNTKQYSHSQAWISNDRKYCTALKSLFLEEPAAEASLVHQLSCNLPAKAFVYLGNSLPIREWDLAASYEQNHFEMAASRGINGIDGQISTFLGLCHSQKSNWGLFGDLTALYDFAAPWILPQIAPNANIVVINNFGAQIFSRMFKHQECLNLHELSFQPFAQMWNLRYEKWEAIPATLASYRGCLIEINPDLQASERFWNQLAKL